MGQIMTRLFKEIGAFILVLIIMNTGVMISFLVKGLFLVGEYPNSNFLSPSSYALFLSLFLILFWNIGKFVLSSIDVVLEIIASLLGGGILSICAVNFIFGNLGLKLIEYDFADTGVLAVLILLLWSFFAAAAYSRAVKTSK